MSLFTKFGTMKQLPPTDKAVQEKVAVLQSYINENFYTCNNEILKDWARCMYAMSVLRKTSTVLAEKERQNL